MSRLPQVWRVRWLRWLDKRIPKRASITLSHRSLFIFASRSGGSLILGWLVIMVTAINYQNSLVYALAFWLFSMGLATMLFTFHNAAGVTLRAGASVSGFAGETFMLPVIVSSARGGAHHSLALSFTPQDDASFTLISLKQGDARTVTLAFVPAKRGALNSGRFKLTSHYPLGLFRVWSWVQLDMQGWVYPKPQWVPFVFSHASGDPLNEPSTRSRIQRSGDDVQGVRSYQEGDSLQRIAWKASARGKGWVSKEMSTVISEQCWLDWHCTPGRDVEQKLSQLCAWVLEADARGWRYGLRLPNEDIAPDQGGSHKLRCLERLARYQA